jgi:carboxylesterase type B
MVDLWANFVISGDPNLPKSLEISWPKYNRDEEFYLELNKVRRILSDFTNEFTAAVQDVRSAAGRSPISLILPLFAIFVLKFIW